MTDHDGQNNQFIANVGEATTFLWSPTGNSIAILDTNVPTNTYYEGLRLVDLEDGSTKTLTDEQVLSFFGPQTEKS